MACYVCPDEDVDGVSWVHSDCTDRTSRGDWTRERRSIGSAGGRVRGAASNERPRTAAVGRLVETYASLRVAGAVWLAGSHVQGIAACVIRVEGD